MKFFQLKKSNITWYGVIAMVLLVILDQMTKILARVHLKGQEPIVLIPNILELRYLYPENKGIAFGLFQGKVFIFVILTIIMTAAIIYIYSKIPKKVYYLPLSGVCFLILAGAAGNFIDRIFRGYVIDFIYIPVIDFPIFNLADVYTVVGTIIVLLLVFFKYKEEDFDFINTGK